MDVSSLMSTVQLVSSLQVPTASVRVTEALWTLAGLSEFKDFKGFKNQRRQDQKKNVHNQSTAKSILGPCIEINEKTLYKMSTLLHNSKRWKCLSLRRIFPTQELVYTDRRRPSLHSFYWLLCTSAINYSFAEADLGFSAQLQTDLLLRKSFGIMNRLTVDRCSQESERLRSNTIKPTFKSLSILLTYQTKSILPHFRRLSFLRAAMVNQNQDSDAPLQTADAEWARWKARCSSRFPVNCVFAVLRTIIKY